MSELALPLALFFGGLASGLHCTGMCGGISTGFGLLQKQNHFNRQLAFNFGRIASYAAAGAAAGTLGSAGAYMAAVLPAQIFLHFASSGFVLLAGLQLWGAALPLSALERIGLPLWRRLQPLAVALLRRGSFAGGPAQGALAMAAFGAGTLPWLLAAGVLAARFRGALQLRRAGGLLLIGFGAWGIAQGVEQTILCL